MAFSLYLHFPYCRNKCSYCDFYKEKYDRDAEVRFYRALATETRLVSDQWNGDRRIDSIFVGGGTPSLTSLELFADWLSLLEQHFQVDPDVEFTLECNPESVTVEKLRMLGELGVNRPTFGIQSFKPNLLKLLSRRHRPADSHRAVYWANALGFTNFGVDLIFGLPRQNSRMLTEDLSQLIDLEPPHISFYQLTVEPGTPLHRKVTNGTLRMIDDDLSLAMYRAGCEHLAAAGYHRYEVSSFAQPGFECRHNIGYWEGRDYLGLGPSAHSFVGSTRFYNVADVREYVTSLACGELPRAVDDSGLEQRMTEAILLGLRMSKGISRSEFSRRFGQPVEGQLNRKQYDLFVESGHVIPDRGRIRLSEQGLYVADEITRRLLK